MISALSLGGVKRDSLASFYPLAATAFTEGWEWGQVLLTHLWCVDVDRYRYLY